MVVINGRGGDGIRGESGARGGNSHIFDEPLGTRLLPLPNERTPWTCRKGDGEAGRVWKGKSLERRRDGWMDHGWVGRSFLAYRLAIEGSS